ncbi:MAG: hypothetical protein B6D64_11660 [Bacteroidetes bacterium 4484_276]|nr:MAG: hypothetical protein B6D64_11660 [Bacteroidetes bacterium 4484_276]
MLVRIFIRILAGKYNKIITGQWFFLFFFIFFGGSWEGCVLSGNGPLQQNFPSSTGHGNVKAKSRLDLESNLVWG